MQSNMKKCSALLGVEDYRLFCMALTQRYVGYAPGEARDFLAEFIESRGKGFKALTRSVFKALPEEDQAKLRLAIREERDQEKRRTFYQIQNYRMLSKHNFLKLVDIFAWKYSNSY